MERNIQNIKNASAVFNSTIDETKEKLVKEYESSYHIDIELLKQVKHHSIVLFEIISKWGFNAEQTLSILNTIDEQFV